LYSALAILAPQFGHVAAPAGGGGAAGAPGVGSSFAPQYAQNGMVASTRCPQVEHVGPVSPVFADPPAAGAA
jgi:hypothetical protein